MRRLTTLLITLDAVLLLWASQAAWGRLDLRDARYTVGLLGVSRIADADGTTGSPAQCGWYDAPPVAQHCERADGAVLAYRLVRLAPVAAAIAVVAFVLAAFAHIRPESGPTGLGPPTFALASAAAVIACILLLTHNVSRALGVFAGHEVEMRGSGLNAGWLAVLVLLAVAAISPYAAPQRPTIP